MAASHYSDKTGYADTNAKCWDITCAVPLHRPNLPIHCWRAPNVRRSSGYSVGRSGAPIPLQRLRREIFSPFSYTLPLLRLLSKPTFIIILAYPGRGYIVSRPSQGRAIVFLAPFCSFIPMKTEYYRCKFDQNYCRSQYVIQMTSLHCMIPKMFVLWFCKRR